MLILSRKIGEKIILSIDHNNIKLDDIIIEIVDLQGSRIRIGITAPKAVNIIREELK